MSDKKCVQSNGLHTLCETRNSQKRVMLCPVQHESLFFVGFFCVFFSFVFFLSLRAFFVKSEYNFVVNFLPSQHPPRITHTRYLHYTVRNMFVWYIGSVFFVRGCVYHRAAPMASFFTTAAGAVRFFDKCQENPRLLAAPSSHQLARLPRAERRPWVWCTTTDPSAVSLY